MSAIYVCRHHQRQELTHQEAHWRLCGCDGTQHMACEIRSAPDGTPRPDGWPIFRAWPVTGAPERADQP